MRLLPRFDVSSHLSRGVAALCLSVLLLGLAGCGSDDTDPSAAETDDSVSENTDGTSSLDTMLLTPEQMPGVNQETLWVEDESGPEDEDGISDCQKTDLLTIGADDAISRDLEAAGQNASAGQVVASFADDKSAWRAHQTVKSWLQTCAQRLDDDVVKVSNPRAVKVPGGRAHVVIAQHGNANAEEHEFDGIGVVRKGSMLSVIQIDVISQDYNYEPGQDPATRAVRAAARKLG